MKQLLLISIYIVIQVSASLPSGVSDELQLQEHDVNNNHLFNAITGIREVMSKLVNKIGQMEEDIATIKQKIGNMEPNIVDIAKAIENFNQTVTLTNKIGNLSDSVVDFVSQSSLIQNTNVNHQLPKLSPDSTENYSNVTMAFDNFLKNETIIKGCKKSFGNAIAKNSAVPKLMSVNKIPGTELYTGIFYKMGMKSFPEAWVTWTAEVNNDKAHFIQIDLDPEHSTNYAPGESYEYDNQWLFGETEIPGYYTLMNRGIPKGLATWTDTKRGSGNLLILSTKPEHATLLSKGGSLRNNAMWAPKATDEQNYYQLKLKEIPQGVITWTYDKYRNISHYIIVATKEEDLIQYKPQGKWYDDSLFKLEPADLILEGRIFDFEFADGALQDILRNSSAPRIETSGFEINQSNEKNSDQLFTLDRTTTTINTFTFEFPFPFPRAISKTKIQVSLPMSTGCTEFSFQQGSSGMEQHPIKSFQVQATKVLAQIRIPKSSMLSLAVNTEWVQNLKIPFVAKMEVTGTAARIREDGSRRGYSGPVPSSTFRQSLMSEVNIVDSSTNALVMEVAGTLTATFATRAIVKCSSCHIDSIFIQQSSFISSSQETVGILFH